MSNLTKLTTVCHRKLGVAILVLESKIYVSFTSFCLSCNHGNFSDVTEK